MKSLLISILLIVFSSHALAAGRAWFATSNPIVNCEQYTADGKDIAMKLEVRGKKITLINLVKNETTVFEGRISQLSSSKLWKNPSMELYIDLKPSRWGKSMGDRYHNGTLEIIESRDTRHHLNFYCYPVQPKK